MATDADALNAQVDLVRVVGHLAGPIERKGNEYVGRCVNHAPDDHPSMYVRPRKGVVTCKSCGFEADALHFVMHVMRIDESAAAAWLKSPPELTPALTAPKRIPPPERVTSKPPAEAGSPTMALRSGPPSIVWPYLDTDGSILGYVARYPGDDGEDTFRTWTWGSVGGAPPTWAIGNWTPLRPLYGLDRLAKRPDDPVAVGWTERAADAIARLLPGYVCVTWPGNRQAIHKADWLPLKGRRVTLFPATGGLEWRAQEGLANLLASPYLHCQVDRIDPNQMPPGWDLSVAVAEGWTTDQTIAWGRPRKTAYTYGAPEPQETPAESLEPDPIPEQSPKRPRRPTLATVGGKVVAEVADELEGEDALPMALSESGVALEFVNQCCDDLRYVHEWEAWLRWDGHRWLRESNRQTATQRMRDLCAGLKYRPEARELTPKSKQGFERKNFLFACLDLAEFDRRIILEPSQFDSDPFQLCTPAGTVDLKTGKLCEPDPADYITRCTAVASVEGPHPLFDQVVECATNGNADMRAYLWRWLGYILTGTVQEAAFLFLYGKPACGKSTFVEAIAGILGLPQDSGYAAKVPVELFTENKHDRSGNTHVLHGVRFAFCAETEENRHWKSALLKEVTGGDTLTGERKYENIFSFRPSHKLLIHGNHKPHMRTADEGLRRRMHLLEYANDIPEDKRDLEFKSKLTAEYPAILAAMIRGCMQWHEFGGLLKPQQITDTVSEYFSDEDTFGQWLIECCTVSPSMSCGSTEAYKAYQHYCDEMGERPPSHKRFAMMLKGKGYEITKSGTKRIVGLTLAPTTAWTPDPTW